MKNFWKIFCAFSFVFILSACSGTIDGPEQNGGEEEVPLKAERPGPDFVSAYRKHVALWEFTGAWCANCPEGYTNMNFTLTANSRFKEVVHPMAFHSNTAAEDDLAIEETDQIMNDMNVSSAGFPSYAVDMMYGGSLVESVMLKEHLSETLEDNPCFCGLAVSSDVKDGVATAEIKLYSELNAPWRVGVYVVEDKVKYYQKDGMLENDSYTHRHVVRRIESASYKGDRIGGQITPSGTELIAEYEIEIDSQWNLDNTYVYVLALDSDGHVNNMNYCLISGGKSDYDKI